MNKIKCLNCNTILESKYRHDFVTCTCNNKAFTDGGDVYIRLGAKDLTLVAVWDDKSKEFKKTVL